MNATVRLGRSLRHVRERQGLSIEHLSSLTTIPVADIEALEAGQWDALPRGMYRRAEVRAYADAVGLDPAETLAQFQSALAGGAMDSAAATPPVVFDSVFADEPAVDSEPATGDPRTAEPRSAEPRTAEPATAEPAAAAATQVVPPAVRVLQRARATRPPHVGPLRRAAPVLTLGLFGILLLAWTDRTGRPALAEPDGPVMSLPLGLRLDVPRPPVEGDEFAPAPPESPEPEAAPAPTLSKALFASRAATDTGQPWRRYSARDEGVLVVRSQPPGARVTINGVGWGVTPVTVRYLPLGTQRVRLVKDDHRSQERVVRLERGQARRTLNVVLQNTAPSSRATANTGAGAPVLVVSTQPEGARVTVNGIGWGETPVTIRNLAPGPQRIRVVSDGYLSEERTVQLGRGTRRVTIPLRAQR